MVVDDHPIFLKGLVEVLQEELPESLISSCGGSVEALRKCTEMTPDIAIFDLDMPEMNGIELSVEVRKRMPNLKIILLTMHKEIDIIKSVLAMGINGYVFKDDAVIDVVIAIEKVMNDEIYISKAANLKPNSTDLLLISTLTRTEKIILKYIAENYTSKQIADRLSVSTKTIDNHRNNISRKLQLTGSNSLIKFAVSNKKTLDLTQPSL
jgi:DNA-binding NarL/FixJ family response regulator